jgi:hypothetical protein
MTIISNMYLQIKRSIEILQKSIFSLISKNKNKKKTATTKNKQKDMQRQC